VELNFKAACKRKFLITNIFDTRGEVLILEGLLNFFLLVTITIYQVLNWLDQDNMKVYRLKKIMCNGLKSYSQ